MTAYIDPEIGTTLRFYRKQKKLTQQALGELLDQVLVSRGAASGIGMSKSFISRIEKALFIPPQNKLEIMVELLEITAADAQRIFTLCGYSTPMMADSAASRIENLQHQLNIHPYDVLTLLDLVSLLNQERQFQKMQQVVLEALLHLEKAELPAHTCTRALLLAKQQLGYALSDREAEQESRYLELSLKFLAQAQAALPKTKDLAREILLGLKAEILRTTLSVQYRIHIKQMTSASLDKQSQGFAELEILLAELSQCISQLEDCERVLHLKLYVQRERISLRFKQFERLECVAFHHKLVQLGIVHESVSEQEQARVLGLYLQGADHTIKRHVTELYGVQDGVLQIGEINAENDHYDSLSQAFFAFLDEHHALLKHGQGPEQLPLTGILNTYFLYLCLLSRFDTFHIQGEYLLKSIYFICKNQHLSTWHYVSSYFYACRYLLRHDQLSIDQSLLSWQHWSQVPPEDQTRYNAHRFVAMVQEPVLWLAYFKALNQAHERSDGLLWLKKTLTQVLFE